MYAALVVLAVLAKPPAITVTRWHSPDSSRPTSFHEWQRRMGGPIRWQVRPVLLNTSFGRRCDLLVEDSLLSRLALEIDTLVSDLAAESTAVSVFAVSGTQPESLRLFLRERYGSGVSEAVLIGNLPVAWFQMIDDWNSSGTREPDEEYEEFPTDIFYMDIDGEWLDTLVPLDTLDSLIPGTDGIYDTHSGNIFPELAVSRLPAAAVGDPVVLLQQYFQRNHAYRHGRLPVAEQALIYVDDDWAPYAADWSADVGYLYPSRLLVVDPETTRCLDYRRRIDTTAQQWISLCSHSWPGGHAMQFNHGRNWDWFYADEIPTLNPVACFYNLFACSNARFVEPGFCAGTYVLRTTTGLGAVGSTKTGSMLEFGDFYYFLNAGKTIGAALREWLYWRMFYEWEPWEQAWFFGMTCIGDGTLRPRLSQTGIALTTVSKGQPLLSLVPNPSRAGSVQVTIEGLNRLTDISVYDTLGRALFSRQYHSNHPSRAQFRIDNLSAGVYTLRLTDGNSSVTQQLVVIP